KVPPARLQGRGIQAGDLMETRAMEPLINLADRSQHDAYGCGSVVALGQPDREIVDKRPEQRQGGITVMGFGENRFEHRNPLLSMVPGLAQVPMLRVRDSYVE